MSRIELTSKNLLANCFCNFGKKDMKETAITCMYSVFLDSKKTSCYFCDVCDVLQNLQSISGVPPWPFLFLNLEFCVIFYLATVAIFVTQFFR